MIYEQGGHRFRRDGMVIRDLGRVKDLSTATVGRAAEHFVKHRLEEEGFLVVRAAGSKGLADLMAIDPDHALVLLVSVKVNSWPSGEERTRCYDFALRARNYNNIRIICARRDNRAGWRVLSPVALGADIAIPAWDREEGFTVRRSLGWPPKVS